MTLKITVPLNGDGSPRRHPDTGAIWPHTEFTPDHEGHTDGDGCGVFVTSPLFRGVVTLSDGRVYNLGAEAIEHLPGDGGRIAHHVEVALEGRGAIVELTGEPFVHVCTEACGPEATAPEPPAEPPADEAPPAPEG